MADLPALSFRGKPLASLTKSRIKWTPSEVGSMDIFLSLPFVTAFLRDYSGPLPDSAFSSLPLADLWEILGWTDFLDEVTQNGQTVGEIVKPKISRKLASLWKKRIQEPKQKIPVKVENHTAQRRTLTRTSIKYPRENRIIKTASPRQFRPRASTGPSTIFDHRSSRSSHHGLGNRNVLSSTTENLEAAVAAMRFLINAAASKDRSPVSLDLGQGFQYKPQVHVHFPSRNLLPASEVPLPQHSTPRLPTQQTDHISRPGMSEQVSVPRRTTDHAPMTVSGQPQLQAERDVFPLGAIPEHLQSPKPKLGSQQVEADASQSATTVSPIFQSKGSREFTTPQSTQFSGFRGPSVSVKSGGPKSTTSSTGKSRRRSNSGAPEAILSLYKRLCRYLRISFFALMLFSLMLITLFGVYYASNTLPTEYKLLIGLPFMTVPFIPFDRAKRKLRTKLGKLGYRFIAKCLIFATGLILSTSWIHLLPSPFLSFIISTTSGSTNDDIYRDLNSTSRFRNRTAETPLSTTTGTFTFMNLLIRLCCCLVLGFVFMTAYRLIADVWDKLLSMKNSASDWIARLLWLKSSKLVFHLGLLSLLYPMAFVYTDQITFRSPQAAPPRRQVPGSSALNSPDLNLRNFLPAARNLIDQRSVLQEKVLKERGQQIKVLKDEIDRLKQQLAVSLTVSAPKEGEESASQGDDQVQEEQRRLQENIAAHQAALQPLEELFRQVVEAGEDRALRDLARLNDLQRRSRAY
ncbi:hypothetical protein BKA65DRAFT_560426 [Rhexocercosporidium sp. MPI-PUGE-AT-0058]|nr:hypothetical protein BKA65DRAFT_560426 [Rhexocercosporidium sp. MPI-PUGE-AT-0058]